MRFTGNRENPVRLDPRAVIAFYEQFAKTLHEHGIVSRTTGGIACMVYGLTEFTKDCDLIIPIERCQQVLELLSRTRLKGYGPHYTLKYGAPMDTRWLNGGWSSHTYLGEKDVIVARLDFFAHAPRVLRADADENPLYLSRDGVARMKKTRRDKDWAYSTLLGDQMLQRGDSRGFLHLFDEKLLLEQSQRFPIPDSLVRERPLLRLVKERSSETGRYMRAEAEFWRRLDDLRLQIYERAWCEYGERLQADSKLKTGDLLSQHARLVEIAASCLDANPVKTFGENRLIQQAKEETRDVFRELDLRLLPEPVIFLKRSDPTPEL